MVNLFRLPSNMRRTSPLTSSPCTCATSVQIELLDLRKLKRWL